MTAPTWQYQLLFDGDCPLCRREVNVLRRRDRGQGRIDFVDIASPDYDPSAHADISFEQAMGRIHAIAADGTILQDMEVFRRLYQAVGLGWIYTPTEWPLIRPLVDRLYAFWAAIRLPLTGRPSLDSLAEQRRCTGDRCRR